MNRSEEFRNMIAQSYNFETTSVDDNMVCKEAHPRCRQLCWRFTVSAEFIRDLI